MWDNQTQSTNAIISNQSINLSVRARDPVALYQAILATNETGTWQNWTDRYGSPVTLSNSTSWAWANFTWSRPGQPTGEVAWKVYLQDSSGNWNATDNRTFNVTLCAESWACTDWSSCDGGTQTRTCTDANACGTAFNKPAESQSCSTGGGPKSSPTPTPTSTPTATPTSTQTPTPTPPPNFTLDIRVTTQTYASVEGASVYVDGVLRGTTGSNGYVLGLQVPIGTHTIRATHPSYIEGTKTFSYSLPDGRTAILVIAGSRGIQVRSWYNNADWAPLPNVSVWVNTDSSGAGGSLAGTTDGSGTLALPDLPGTTYLKLSHPLYQEAVVAFDPTNPKRTFYLSPARVHYVNLSVEDAKVFMGRPALIRANLTSDLGNTAELDGWDVDFYVLTDPITHLGRATTGGGGYATLEVAGTQTAALGKPGKSLTYQLMGYTGGRRLASDGAPIARYQPPGSWLTLVPFRPGEFRGNEMVGTLEVTETFSAISSLIRIDDPASITCIPLLESGDPSSKLDITFVGSGFASPEQFRAFAEKVVDLEGTQGGLFAVEPFKSNKDRINVWVVNKVPTFGAMDPISLAWAAYDLDLWNCPGQDQTVLIAAVPPTGWTHPRAGFVTWIGNRGISAVATYSPDPNDAQAVDDARIIVLHELGHAFGHLNDEYVEEGRTPWSGANCDTQSSGSEDLACPLWSWAENGSSAVAADVGCYAGCTAPWAHRPTWNSIMRAPWYDRSYHAVNEAILQKHLEAYG